MKIGTAVQVLPLCHPLRLAEEVATIDHLSNGRLIFGVGRSGFAHTYATYGVDYGESRERFTETLAIVKRAFTEDRFSHKGKFYAYENVRLSPRPVQRPWPEIRTSFAVMSGCLRFTIRSSGLVGSRRELLKARCTFSKANLLRRCQSFLVTNLAESLLKSVRKLPNLK